MHASQCRRPKTRSFSWSSSLDATRRNLIGPVHVALNIIGRSNSTPIDLLRSIYAVSLTLSSPLKTVQRSLPLDSSSSSTQIQHLISEEFYSVLRDYFSVLLSWSCSVLNGVSESEDLDSEVLVADFSRRLHFSAQRFE